MHLLRPGKTEVISQVARCTDYWYSFLALSDYSHWTALKPQRMKERTPMSWNAVCCRGKSHERACCFLGRLVIAFGQDLVQIILRSLF